MASTKTKLPVAANLCQEMDECIRAMKRSTARVELALEASTKIKARLRRLEEENAEMRLVLVNYYNTETAYEAENSTQRYGRYKDASAALVALAKKMAERSV